MNSSFTVANEFAEVTVSLVRHGNGDRVQIEAPRWGTRIWLDPIELEAITWQKKETFSRLLEESVKPVQRDAAKRDLPQEGD